MIIFNGNDLSTDIRVTSIKRFVLPTSVITSTNLVGKDGVYFSRKLHDAQTFEVNFSLIQTDLAALRTKVRDLAAKLNTDKPQKLYFKDEPDKYYYAIVIDSTDLEEIIAVGQGTIKFFCPDPIAYGIQKTQTVTNNVAFTYNGTYKAKPVITVNVNASISYFKITHQQSGEFLYLTQSFVAGDVITLDIANEVVKLNGASIMANLSLDSDFFTLQPGTNTFLIDPVISTSFVFDERWL